jgi:pimeloyl-ACP methyl ester carboxylesterase
MVLHREHANASSELSGFVARTFESPRHRSAYLETGPSDGPLAILLHGWPELGLVWRPQMEFLAARGWRCIAPDMRGYGGSSVPTSTSAYAVRESVADMIELHDALGAAPALWIGHDWGSPVVWALAVHHADRCRAVANLCVPYLARGFTLANLIPLVDRERYPTEAFPVGQWDYWLYHRQNFSQSAADLEADVAATIATFYRRGNANSVGRRTPLANLRANGGWFGEAHRALAKPREESLLNEVAFNSFVGAFSNTGFSGANAWYLNDAANAAYAALAPGFGRLTLPVLFVHAAWDAVCDTVHSRLAEPMRADCADLTEVVIEGGHELTLERPSEVNGALDRWLAAKAT